MIEAGEGYRGKVDALKSRYPDLPSITEKSVHIFETIDTLLGKEFLKDTENRRLVGKVGIPLWEEVTEEYGSDLDHVKRSKGKVEEFLMAYHHGGEKGHTSIGLEGAGIVRNVILIANNVNAASKENGGPPIYTDRMIAIGIAAAMGHDRDQLCGRALMEEGQQGEEYGDERLSAIRIKKKYLDVLSEDGIDPSAEQQTTANLLAGGVWATAFDMTTKAQNVQYPEQWQFNPENLNEYETQSVLIQELLTGADLLGPTTVASPVDGCTNIIEQMCSRGLGSLLQTRLGEEGFDALVKDDGFVDLDAVFVAIDADNIPGDEDCLKAQFDKRMQAQVDFFSKFLRYSDATIRGITGGKGILELFPGILLNTTIAKENLRDLKRDPQDPQYATASTIWERAKAEDRRKAMERQIDDVSAALENNGISHASYVLLGGITNTLYSPAAFPEDLNLILLDESMRDHLQGEIDNRGLPISVHASLPVDVATSSEFASLQGKPYRFPLTSELSKKFPINNSRLSSTDIMKYIAAPSDAIIALQQLFSPRGEGDLHEEDNKSLQKAVASLTGQRLMQFREDIALLTKDYPGLEAEVLQKIGFMGLTQEAWTSLSDELSPTEKNIRDLCWGLEKSSPAFRGVYQFGTDQGDRIDLRLLSTTVPENDESQVIQQQFQSRFQGLGIDAMIQFITPESLGPDAKIDLTQFAQSEGHLPHNKDPYYQPKVDGDTSLFLLYTLSSMTPKYSVEGEVLPLPQNIINIENIPITPDAATEWAHYYTGCFLGEYRHYQQNTDLSSPAYQDSLGKFLPRVTLGSTLAQLDAEQLVRVKAELTAAMQNPEGSLSADQKITDFLLNNSDTRYLLADDSKQLLQLAGEVQGGSKTAFDKDFVRQAESMLFYNASLQSIGRGEPGSTFNRLISYAIEASLGDPELNAQLLQVNAGDTIIRQGEHDDRSLYYVPLREDTPGVAVVVESDQGTFQFPKNPGDIFGEGALFGIHDRSATVVATQDETRVWKINAEKIREILADPNTFVALQNQVLESNELRLADVVLQYFAKESGAFIRRLLPHTTYAPEAVTDTTSPLEQYNLGDSFHAILASYVGEANAPLVVEKPAPSSEERILFEQDAQNNTLYVVSEGTVTIQLENGQMITRKKGEVFGESSLLGLPTTGKATLSSGGQVLAVDALSFQQFTQSRKSSHGILPRQLLYHLAYVGYDRVRGHLAQT